MFEDRTREFLKSRMMGRLNASSGLNAMEGGFADQCFGPMSVELETAYMTMDTIWNIFAIDASCGWLIDMAAGNISVTRKDGVKAKATITFQGTAGAVVEEGALFATQSGLIYALTGTVVIDATGTGTGVIEALEAGKAYEVAAGVIDRAFVNPVGVESFSVGAASGGVDVEGDEALVGRYYDKLQRPSTSSNPNDYRKWAMEVPGVGEAKVISIVNGPGTVGVTLVSEDFGPVDATVVAAALAHIQGSRTVGIKNAPTVQSATATAINVTVVSELDTSVTAATVAAKLKEALAAYCKELVREKYAQTYDKPEEDLAYTLSYNRVATLFMVIPGVKDYTSLKINGGTADITIGKDAVPTAGEVTVT